MANVRRGSVFYIDTQYSSASDELSTTGKNVCVQSVVLTSTGANAVFVLGDGSQPLVELRLAASGSSEMFDYHDYPFRVSSSLRPITLTNAKVSIVLREDGG